MNICLLGLTGSGKTCYLYTAAHVLSKGVDVAGHMITVTASDLQHRKYLNNELETMVETMKWPAGSLQTTLYPFKLKLDGQEVLSFELHDFKGGILENFDDTKSCESREELFDSFADSRCIVIFVDGDTVLDVLEGTSQIKKLKAVNRLNYIEALVEECQIRMGEMAPVLLVITKSDEFDSVKLDEGKEVLKKFLPSLFPKPDAGMLCDVVAGITHVTLGKDLGTQGDREMTGTLCLNTDGNLHLPMLFALFQEEWSVSPADRGRMIRNLFSNGKVALYKNGVPAEMF